MMISNYRRRVVGILAILSALATPITTDAQVQAVKPFAGTAMRGLVDSIIFVINALLVLAALAAIAYIILSGVRYVTSQGDEATAEEAKRGLIYALIGIIIILLAFVIVNYFIVAVV